MTAFQATYSDFKLIRTRKVVQIVLEVPVEQSNTVLEVLGGMPNPASERWVGVAVLKSPPAEKESDEKPRTPAKLQPDTDKPSAGAKRDWRSLPAPQRAAIRTQEPIFAAYLRERHPDEWHEADEEADACLKFICKIESKRDLAFNDKARTMFDLLDSDFLGWKALENA